MNSARYYEKTENNCERKLYLPEIQFFHKEYLKNSHTENIDFLGLNRNKSAKLIDDIFKITDQKKIPGCSTFSSTNKFPNLEASILEPERLNHCRANNEQRKGKKPDQLKESYLGINETYESNHERCKSSTPEIPTSLMAKGTNVNLNNTTDPAHPLEMEKVDDHTIVKSKKKIKIVIGRKPKIKRQKKIRAIE